ncbi:MAG: threonine synthase [Firmicutes bacterium]|nr:threonine synthase [Bacillota bacterium]
MRAGIIARYREHLALPAQEPIITLLEGDTPLIPVPSLARELGIPAELYVKWEGANPTGSFKDRGMTVAVTDAVMRGARAVLCASTGNTSASAAAYAARAGVPCYVLMPKGAVAKGKLAQTLMHGARVVEVEGNFDDALELVRQLSAQHGLAVVNSINPARLEGQKTAAFEICDALGDAPDFLALPVGNAGNITAYWMGFREYHALGKSSRLPRLLGFQSAGAAPIVEGRPIDRPETVATAIRIGRPASWKKAEAARDESGGLIDKVTDDEILAAYRLAARREGVFCEPASAASLAGVARLAREGFFRPGQRIVCVLTGHGLKDPDRATEESDDTVVLPARAEALAEVLLQ